MKTLGEFVEERGWIMGEGFIEGTSRKQPGEHLTGKPFLPTLALTDDGLDAAKLETVTATSFYRPGRPVLFEPPLVLIREHESLPIAYWDKGALAFKDKIVGVHAPQIDRAEHKRFYERLHSNRGFFRFAVMLNGSQALVGKATALLKSDIESLPFPDDDSELDLAFWEQVLAEDTLQYMARYVRLGQESELLIDAAGTDALRDYASLFCRLLGSLYDNLRPSKPLFLDGLICQPFLFGEETALEWLDWDLGEDLKQLVFEQALPSLRTVRVVRFYHENAILIIKPDRLRYWIRSTAIRDADDTLVELRDQGY